MELNKLIQKTQTPALLCSGIQFLTSGGGSKAWKGDANGLHIEGLKFYYDGQGFMSIQLTEIESKIAFHDIFGRNLYHLNLSKSLHLAI